MRKPRNGHDNTFEFVRRANDRPTTPKCFHKRSPGNILISGLEKSLTMADADFLKKLFIFSQNKPKIKPLPSSAKNATADSGIAKEIACQAGNSEEISRIGLPRNAPKEELIQATFNSKMAELRLKMEKHNSPRCAKCFKRASCQVNCCDFHVYCDSCRYEDPSVLTVSCEKRDCVTKEDVAKCKLSNLKTPTKSGLK